MTAVALLAACAARNAPPAAPDTPEVAACNAEWTTNPERRRLMQERFASNELEIDRRIEEARMRARHDCLQRRGVVEGGGVERVRR